MGKLVTIYLHYTHYRINSDTGLLAICIKITKQAYEKNYFYNIVLFTFTIKYRRETTWIPTISDHFSENSDYFTKDNSDLFFPHNQWLLGQLKPLFKRHNHLSLEGQICTYHILKKCGSYCLVAVGHCNQSNLHYFNKKSHTVNG